ncbi:hypothetical protein LTR84_011058 [Exophiala bonariae]|uniref:Ubiquitin-like protease family profile domain-containing protein n=1 Tax=Exophiala bonariae TaxID=1690606 RepID=A0AAV9NIL1_9EURO|nr:hypothetical protein LTR84_011058 [Exophiala bonariae]
MPLKWTDAVLDGLQSVVSAFNPANLISDPEHKSEPGAQPGSVPDNHNHIRIPSQRIHDRAPPVVASHASITRSFNSRVQMPRSRSSPRQRKPSNVKGFLSLHDNAECDPIVLNSDEEDNHPHPPPSRKPSTQTFDYSRSHPHTVLTRAPREESKLMATVSTREPDATTIPDPMMTRKSSFVTGGHRPINTLDQPTTNNSRAEFESVMRQAPREGQLQYSISSPKVNPGPRANDHDIPNKRLKVAHPSKPGASPGSAIRVDNNSQSNIDDSPDELQLSPPSDPRPRKPALSQKQHPEAVRNGLVVGNKQVVSVDLSRLSRHTSPSPEHEDRFTKNSAKRRKQEKDHLLSSSSPVQPPFKRASRQIMSPYFGLSTKVPEPQPKIKNQSETRMETRIKGVQIGTSSSSARPRQQLRGSKLTNALLAGNFITFPLSEVVCSKLDNSNAFVIHSTPESREFDIRFQNPSLSDDSILAPFSITKIIKFFHDDNSSVIIRYPQTADGSEDLHLKFESREGAAEFRRFVQKANLQLKMLQKDEEWMNKALEIAKKQSAGRSVHLENPGPKDDLPITSQLRASTNQKAGRSHRMVDLLDAPTKEVRPPTVISGSERASGRPPAATADVQRAQQEQRAQRRTTRTKVEDPERDGLQRQTGYRQHGPDVDDSRDYADPEPQLAATGILGPRWSRDLVYPKPGKRSATVPFEDLDRLGEDEFLNDNLISFFMQYLETFMEQHNPELHKRTHFFNTYFFERLTQNAKARSIDFAAVSRWTKAINIFNRDFVVVPVNENLHWYLAIICNLPYLSDPPKEENGIQVDTTSEIGIQRQDETHTDKPQIISDVMTEWDESNMAPTTETQNSFAELSLNDSELNQIEKPPFQKKSLNKRKQPRRSLPKYALDKPIIITLDSLGMPRSGTCAILKSYIKAEAKDKQNLDIEDAAIKGMTAKGIPTQRNYSDCGLYLCMYLEQFIADPDNFVARILQREESTQLWPDHIRSEDLRTRLRDLILELHRRQEEETSSYDIPDVGSIMLGERTKSALSDTGDLPTSKEDVQQAEQGFDEFRQVPEHPHTSRTVDSFPDQRQETRDRMTSRRLTRHNETVDKADENSSQPPSSPRFSRRQQATRQRGEADIPSAKTKSPAPARKTEGLTSARFLHNSPASLVADLRQQDEEHENTKRQPRSQFNVNSDNGHKRSDSTFTEYLSGLASYAPSARDEALASYAALAQFAAPACRRSPNKSNKREENTAVKVKADSGSHFSPVSDGSLSHGQIDRKRKRNAGRTAVEIGPIVDDREIPETQQLEPSQSEEFPNTNSTSDELTPRRGKVTPSLKQAHPPIEVEDSEAEDEDLDGQMLL